MADPDVKFRVERVSPLEIELDPENPRIPRARRKPGLTQEDLLELLVRRFKLDDLARSIVATGYTDIDPLIGYKAGGKVVIREGNRRVATLKLLLRPELAPQRLRAKWETLSNSLSENDRAEIQEVSVRVYPDIDAADLEAYIGFRHVSGVLEWPAEEKARFIVDMVDRHGWSYKEISERIGSYSKHVERHYIASRLIEQAIGRAVDGAENITIGVLLRALQTAGISEFLGIDYPGNPEESSNPVPEDHTEELEFFTWATFGGEKKEPILPESRELTKWGQILQSPEAIRYLKSAVRPSFERAWAKSGGELESVLEMIQAAADNLEDSIPLASDYTDDEEILDAVLRCARRLNKLLEDFPTVREQVFPG